MRFTKKHLAFLRRNYVARIATSSGKSEPHISPIYFANDNDSVFFATETSTMKFKNLVENPVAALVVDEFDARWLHEKKSDTSTTEKALVVRGKAEIFVDGEDARYTAMYRKLFEKYPDYRNQNWRKGESPIIKVRANRISSWGI
ncbi:MAG: pyridoxamine 5'-phosphate oxidase family protein [Nitrososphaerales archaeon]